MAEHSYPWEEIVAGDRDVAAAVERQFNAAPGFIGVEGGLAPTKDGATVRISPGAALINGVRYINDAELVLTPAAGTRKDYVVIRYTAADRVAVAAVLEGSSSAFPALTQTSAVYEIAIASVDNSAGAFTVLDTRDAPGLCRMADFIHTVGAAGEPAFQNSWVNFSGANGPAQFAKSAGGLVTVMGVIKSGTVSTVPAFTLPAGFHPAYQRMFWVNSNGATGLVAVNSNGEVHVRSGSNAYVYLDPISFYAS